VAFIGPEQRRHGGREVVRCQQWWVLQWIIYESGGELGGGETEGHTIAKRGRGGGELVSTVTLYYMFGRQAVTTVGLDVEEGRCWVDLSYWVSTVLVEC
jgi:hypothetical protein